MARFNYFNDVNKQLNLDGELKNQIKPRWQRKNESSMNNSNTSMLNQSKLSISYNSSYVFALNTTSNNGNGNSNNKTPNKQSNGDAKKSPGRKTPTPNKNGSKTPTGTCGDRFIPSRVATNFELGHYLINKQQEKNEGNETNSQKATNEQALSEALHGLDINKKRILAFQIKAPAAPDSHLNPLKVIYSVKTPMSSKSGSRYIPTNPERILDAPEIINDYYLNLLDWSHDNVVTVALGQSVYLWNAGTGNIEILFEGQGQDHACSLSWIQEGQTLAVGMSNGTLELWDCAKMRRLRVMSGHTARIGSLAWNAWLISSGSRDGSIIHHDVRQRDHQIGLLQGHTQEVCGLKWSTDAKYLASGGNDNIVNIWSTEGASGAGTSSTPLYTFNEHQAAVRALDWCPWQPNVLASGGGTADRCIKFWNVNTGTCMNSVETKSQVCSLLFSKTYKEIISAHGYANNQLSIWKYPSMVHQVDLTGHTHRILSMAMSPDGSTIMSAGADETLRLWKCFAEDPHLNKKKSAAKEKTSFLTKQSIR